MANLLEGSKPMSTYGADWTPDQNRIIVEAYFSMLRKQQDGEPYVKTQINREVGAQTGKLAAQWSGSSATLVICWRRWDTRSLVDINPRATHNEVR